MQGLKHMFGYRALARDAALGRVEDFLVEEGAWAVRYVVVRSRGLLSGKRLLIPAQSLGSPDPDSRRIQVHLASAGLDDLIVDSETVRSVSSEMEALLSDAHGGPRIRRDRGDSRGKSGPVPVVVRGAPPPARRTRLRSVRELTGYRIETLEGPCGLCTDILADRETWSVPYIVVNTKEWPPHGYVLAPTLWIRHIDWEDMEIEVGVRRSKMQSGQRFDPASHAIWSGRSSYGAAASA